jgi:hypothetical protein
MSIGYGGHNARLEAFDFERHLAAAGRPEAEVNPAAGLRFGADRQASNRRHRG